jgi:hypothetical protein
MSKAAQFVRRARSRYCFKEVRFADLVVRPSIRRRHFNFQLNCTADVRQAIRELTKLGSTPPGRPPTATASAGRGANWQTKAPRAALATMPTCSCRNSKVTCGIPTPSSIQALP